MQGYLEKSLKWLLINYQILLPNFLVFSCEWLGEFDIASKVTKDLIPHTPSIIITIIWLVKGRKTITVLDMWRALTEVHYFLWSSLPNSTVKFSSLRFFVNVFNTTLYGASFTVLQSINLNNEATNVGTKLTVVSNVPMKGFTWIESFTNCTRVSKR